MFKESRGLLLSIIFFIIICFSLIMSSLNAPKKLNRYEFYETYLAAHGMESFSGLGYNSEKYLIIVCKDEAYQLLLFDFSDDDQNPTVVLSEPYFAHDIPDSLPNSKLCIIPFEYEGVCFVGAVVTGEVMTSLEYFGVSYNGDYVNVTVTLSPTAHHIGNIFDLPGGSISERSKIILYGDAYTPIYETEIIERGD